MEKRWDTLIREHSLFTSGVGLLQISKFLEWVIFGFPGPTCHELLQILHKVKVLFSYSPTDNWSPREWVTQRQILWKIPSAKSRLPSTVWIFDGIKYHRKIFCENGNKIVKMIKNPYFSFSHKIFPRYYIPLKIPDSWRKSEICPGDLYETIHCVTK